MALHRDDARVARHHSVVGVLAVLWWASLACRMWWVVVFLTVVILIWCVALAWR